MQRSNKGIRNFLSRVDFFLLIPAVLLAIISLSTLLSINTVFFRQQILSLGLSIGIFILFTKLDLGLFSNLSRYLYFGIIFLLILVLLIGVEVNGARSWFEILGVRLQISEIAKPLFIVVLVTFLCSKVTKRIYRFLGAILLVLPFLFPAFHL